MTEDTPSTVHFLMATHRYGYVLLCKNYKNGMRTISLNVTSWSESSKPSNHHTDNTKDVTCKDCKAILRDTKRYC